jgi:hypothetical protein
VSKSSKHRAISRARHEAALAGKLPEFYAQREAVRSAEKLAAAEAIAPAPATEPMLYTPSAAFALAYSGPEVGPVGMRWTEGARHPTWTLSTNADTPRFSRNRNA